MIKEKQQKSVEKTLCRVNFYVRTASNFVTAVKTQKSNYWIIPRNCDKHDKEELRQHCEILQLCGSNYGQSSINNTFSDIVFHCIND